MMIVRSNRQPNKVVEVVIDDLSLNHKIDDQILKVQLILINLEVIKNHSVRVLKNDLIVRSCKQATNEIPPNK